MIPKRKITSAKYSLNIKDVLKSLLVAIGTPILVEIQRIADSGIFIINWKQMAMIAIGACAAYLIKNFFTPATVQTEVTDEKAKELKEELQTTAK